MEEQFVNYDIAVKLKELGFDEKCLGYYADNKFKFFSDLENCNTNTEFGFYPTAPLLQQVLDWLREKQNIHIVISPNLRFNTVIGEELPEDLTYRVIFDNRFYLTYSDNKIPQLCFDLSRGYGFTSYSEAREQAILKALELVTNKN